MAESIACRKPASIIYSAEADLIRSQEGCFWDHCFQYEKSSRTPDHKVWPLQAKPQAMQFERMKEKIPQAHPLCHNVRVGVDRERTTVFRQTAAIRREAERAASARLSGN